MTTRWCLSSQKQRSPTVDDMKELIEEVERLDAAATPRPWHAGRPDMLSYDGDGTGPWKQIYWDDPDAGMHLGQQLPGIVGRMSNRPISDAQAVAFFRTATPRLAEEVKNLEAKIARLEGELACAADLVNTWCRELCILEEHDPYGELRLRNCIDRVWGEVSTKTSALEEKADRLAAENAELRGLLEEAGATLRTAYLVVPQPSISARMCDIYDRIDKALEAKR